MRIDPRHLRGAGVPIAVTYAVGKASELASEAFMGTHVFWMIERQGKSVVIDCFLIEHAARHLHRVTDPLHNVVLGLPRYLGEEGISNEAVKTWLAHMAADFPTSMGLPLPIGSGETAQMLYVLGYNIRTAGINPAVSVGLTNWMWRRKHKEATDYEIAAMNAKNGAINLGAAAAVVGGIAVAGTSPAWAPPLVVGLVSSGVGFATVGALHQLRGFRRSRVAKPDPAETGPGLAEAA